MTQRMGAMGTENKDSLNIPMIMMSGAGSLLPISPKASSDTAMI